MANHKSAQKAHELSLLRAARNKSILSRMKTFIKKLEALLTSGTPEQAREEFRTTESEIFKAVSKGVLHKNTAARKISKLSKKVKEFCLS